MSAPDVATLDELRREVEALKLQVDGICADSELKRRLEAVEEHCGLRPSMPVGVEEQARWSREIDRATSRGRALREDKAEPPKFELPPSLRAPA
jgi:hypothetical protein